MAVGADRGLTPKKGIKAIAKPQALLGLGPQYSQLRNGYAEASPQGLSCDLTDSCNAWKRAR